MGHDPPWEFMNELKWGHNKTVSKNQGQIFLPKLSSQVL